MNNDYIAGRLMRERQADYLREVQRDELAAQLHAAEAEKAQVTTMAEPSPVQPSIRHRWRAALVHLVPGRPTVNGHRS